MGSIMCVDGVKGWISYAVKIGKMESVTKEWEEKATDLGECRRGV